MSGFVVIGVRIYMHKGCLFELMSESINAYEYEYL